MSQIRKKNKNKTVFSSHQNKQTNQDKAKQAATTEGNSQLERFGHHPRAPWLARARDLPRQKYVTMAPYYFRTKKDHLQLEIVQGVFIKKILHCMCYLSELELFQKPEAPRFSS